MYDLVSQDFTQMFQDYQEVHFDIVEHLSCPDIRKTYSSHSSQAMEKYWSSVKHDIPTIEELNQSLFSPFFKSYMIDLLQERADLLKKRESSPGNEYSQFFLIFPVRPRGSEKYDSRVAWAILAPLLSNPVGQYYSAHEWTFLTLEEAQQRGVLSPNFSERPEDILPVKSNESSSVYYYIPHGELWRASGVGTSSSTHKGTSQSRQSVPNASTNFALTTITSPGLGMKIILGFLGFSFMYALISYLLDIIAPIIFLIALLLEYRSWRCSFHGAQCLNIFVYRPFFKSVSLVYVLFAITLFLLSEFIF